MIRRHRSGAAMIALCCSLMILCMSRAHAEPYLAVQQGLKCMQCHVNPTGGGERTLFGEIFSQNTLPATHLDTGNNVWTGALNSFINMGGNLRADAQWNRIRNQPSLAQFSLEQTRIYLSAAVIPDRLTFYVDELLAPGGAANREAWAQLWFDDKTWYVKAGQLYLPFGLRLQDQQAFTRQIAGINMDTPDQGMEVGFEHGAWDAQLAISNGTVGGAASNNGKDFTAQLAHVQSRWRIGAGININSSSDVGQTRAANVFAGVRTGAVVWLTELDQVSAPVAGGASRITQTAGLVEADWLIRRGNNLKVTIEWYDPSQTQSHDMRQRMSVVYELTPIQFLQLRLGYRQLGADQSLDALHQQQVFLQLHAFF